MYQENWFLFHQLERNFPIHCSIFFFDSVTGIFILMFIKQAKVYKEASKNTLYTVNTGDHIHAQS